VAKHIEDLEAHIRAMYDDLVEEFSRKKEQAQVRIILPSVSFIASARAAVVIMHFSV